MSIPEKRVTLNAELLDEAHSAIYRHIAQAYSAANRLRHIGSVREARAIEAATNDLVSAVSPFEVEKP
ncbi:hypothetical protein [Mycobacterium sp. AZCC_0083]|uniref:hypothetical protein n=1 Tax=Mycobacterium sp. AZCC_0083 TaxID=2735882 RepID=UPI0016085D0C|nr:hypothetical protein [Mycobacterium sp. AZCC_0083]MBB5167099.1 hypothetical protein [Mycobacterium sp. AZCC_0083]